MEHLLAPRELEEFSSRLQRTKWLGFDHDSTKEYAICKMQEYPLVHGWTDKQLSSLFEANQFDMKDLSMLQSWLFFGALEACFNSLRFSTAEYVRNGFINTAALRKIPQRLDPDTDYKVLSENIEGVIRIMVSQNDIMRVKAGHNPAVDRVRAVGGIIRISSLLLDILPELAGRFPRRGSQTEMPVASTRQTLPQENLAKARLRVNGWCPSLWPSWMQHRISCCEYACVLTAPGLNPTVKHQYCTEIQCVANKIDPDKYQAKHVSDKCRCDWFAPKEAMEIFSRGKFPVFDAKAILSERKVSKLRKAQTTTSLEQDTQYIAVSHVWAHGLGSTTEVGLPLCALRLLASRVITLFDAVVPSSKKSASNSAYFWIDALGVPKNDLYRKKAIVNMAEIYSNAASVLVLDEDLTKTAFLEHTLATNLMYIYLSDWNSRLWNLQEMALAKLVWFQFNDTIIPLEMNLDAVATRKFPFPVLKLYGRSLAKVRYADFDLSACSQFLRRRSSSRATDEQVVLSQLLGLDVTSVIDRSGTDRWITFWRNVGTVPKEILFMGNRKLTKKGFRWAPHTFMTKSSDDKRMLMESAGEAVVTQNGLRASYNCLIFEQSETLRLEAARRNHNLFARDQSAGVSYWIVPWAVGGFVEMRGSMIVLPERIQIANTRWIEGVVVQEADSSAQGCRTCEYVGMVQLRTRILGASFNAEIEATVQTLDCQYESDLELLIQ